MIGFSRFRLEPRVVLAVTNYQHVVKLGTSYCAHLLVGNVNG
jgi:hypothetical protein